MRPLPEDIYDTKGYRLGRLTPKPNGGLDLHDPKGNRLGRYDQWSNRTLDLQGRPIGVGNQLLRLLR